MRRGGFVSECPLFYPGTTTTLGRDCYPVPLQSSRLPNRPSRRRWYTATLWSRNTRLLGWAEVNDAGPEWNSAETNVARKLDDAWDTSKRSREYLNAADGELEPRYYVHAYP